MRESRLQVFKGMATKATRDYMGGVFAALKGEGYRLVVPCVGRFTLPQVARAAGWDPEWIETSDISLFSSVIGYHAAGRDIAELGIRYSEDLAWLQGHIDDGHAAGAALFAMKLAQLRRSETYYSRTFRDELLRDGGGYVAQFQERADELRAALGPVRYRTADLFAELERSRDADDALVYVNPPGYGGGYTRMFDFGETVAWDAPDIAEFHPKEGVRRIAAWAREAKCLVFWYRIREVTDDERPYVVFGHEQNPGVVDYILCNRPEAVSREAVPRKVTATLPDKAPIIPYDHEITPDSVIGCRAVPKQVALYYRDLCAHKLGVTRAERYFVLTVDGYIFGVTGIFVSDLNRRRLIEGAYPIHETFGFTVPCQYRRMVRLLMMCLTTDQFLGQIKETMNAAAFADPIMFHTTCLSDVPEPKTNRGILKIVNRERLANGKWKTKHIGPFRPEGYQEALGKWREKHAVKRA